MRKQAEALNVVGLEIEDKPKHCEVWEEHAEPLAIFLACDDQWIPGGSGVIGLNMVAVTQMMSQDFYNVRDKLQTIRDVRVIAGRARELINQSAKGG